jgi:hypothetical protein
MALAPSLPLLGVPSSLMRKLSMASWSTMSMPDLMSSGAIMSLTLETALWTPVVLREVESDEERSWEQGRGASGRMIAYPFHRTWSCRRHGARQPREHRWKHHWGQQRGRDLAGGESAILPVGLDPLLVTHPSR